MTPSQWADLLPQIDKPLNELLRKLPVAVLQWIGTAIDLEILRRK
jgi:hypothetical protein